MQLSPADLHILLVEPSEVQRKIIRKKLAEEHVTQIEEADSLASALAKINHHKPDAIACALHLADGTAEQLLKQLDHFSANQPRSIKRDGWMGTRTSMYIRNINNYRDTLSNSANIKR